MYQKDRKKGGGGIIAYFDSSLPSKELKVTKKYKAIEILAVEARLGTEQRSHFPWDIPNPKAVGSPTRHTLSRTCRGGTK